MKKNPLWPIPKKIAYEENYSIDQLSFNSHHNNSSEKSNKVSEKNSGDSDNQIQLKKFFFLI